MRIILIYSRGRYASGMCVQCMAGAMAAGASATGIRAWLVARSPAWLTPDRRRRMTIGLIVCGVLAAGLIGPSAV